MSQEIEENRRYTSRKILTKHDARVGVAPNDDPGTENDKVLEVDKKMETEPFLNIKRIYFYFSFKNTKYIMITRHRNRSQEGGKWEMWEKD